MERQNSFIRCSTEEDTEMAIKLGLDGIIVSKPWRPATGCRTINDQFFGANCEKFINGG
jgi:hypothetical protein